MRKATIAIALVAGTAARFILPTLWRRRRRRPPPPLPPLHPHHRQILHLLDQRAPAQPFSVWSAAHPDPVDCTFCLDSIRSSDLVRHTACGHAFHAHCLDRWVLFVADESLDWRRYSLADDGSIHAHPRTPTCPNCTTDLDVIPPNLLRNTLLTTVACTLRLRDLATASEMYDAGLVYRAPSDASAAASTVAPPGSRPNPRPRDLVTTAPLSASPVSSPLPPHTESALVMRRESGAHEVHLPEMAFVVRPEGILQYVARRFVMPSERRRRANDVVENARVMLQTPS